MSISMLGPVSTLERWREESLYLDFVSGDPMDSRITTVRASEASYFDADGVLKFAPANTPRIDFDPVTGECKGLLVEEARTNPILFSENLTERGAPGAYVTRSDAIAPNGKLAAFNIFETDTATAKFLDLGQATVAQGKQYTLSVYANRYECTRPTIALVVSGSRFTGGNQIVSFNLTTEVVTSVVGASSGTMKDVGRGWYRLTLTTPPAIDAGLCGPQVRASDGSSITFQGVPGNKICVFLPQFEEGAFATSPIPTPATFQSRASTATYFDAQGVLRTAAANEPRYSHGYVDGRWVPTGLIVERAATNVLFPSSPIAPGSSAPWKRGSNTTDHGTEILPSGRVALITSNTSGTAGNDFVSRTASTVPGTTYTVSATLRHVQGPLPTVGSALIVEMQPGQRIALPISAAGLTQQEKRVSLTFTATASFSTVYVFADRNTTAQFSVADVQMEAGSSETSFIETTTSAVTRAADVAPSSAVTRAGDIVTMPTAGWYRQDEGTFVASVAVPPVQPGRFPQIFAAMASKTGETVRAYFNSVGRVRFQVASGGALSFDYTSSATPISGTELVVGLAYKPGDIAGSFSGSLAGTGTGLPMPAVTKLSIGTEGSNALNGHIKRLAYYPRRLPNEQLQRLSTR